MLRIGLISAATYAASYRGEPVERTPGSHHGTAFSSTLNGCDPNVYGQYDWTFVASSQTIEDAGVVKVWDADTQWAQRLAEATSIDEVCDTPQDCATDVDAVIIVDDGSGSQHRCARYPLQNGVPTFCDKPLAMTAKEAREIADLSASTGTPFMSASSLRFVPDIIKLRDSLPELGRIHLATAACGNHLVYYGIHALSMAYAALGPGAVSCINVGREDRNIVRIRFDSGHDVVLLVGEKEYMRAGYQINLYGTEGWKSVQPDTTDLYYHLLKRVVRFFRDGEVIVPINEEVELIAVLEAGHRSLLQGREVTLEEVLQ
ncbi:MAG: Gfo/Idh/MocA family protein [Armatimonadota bacterium]